MSELLDPSKPDHIDFLKPREADSSMTSLNDSCMSIEVEPTSEEMLSEAEAMLADDGESWKQKMQRYSKSELIAMLESKIVASEKSSADLKRLEPVSKLFVKQKVLFV